MRRRRIEDEGRTRGASPRPRPRALLRLLGLGVALVGVGLLQGCRVSAALQGLRAPSMVRAGGPAPGSSSTTPVGPTGTTDAGLPAADGGTVPAPAEGREGHAVLLLHGLGVDGSSLRGMQGYLRAQGLPDVHTLDLPGRGITSTLEECARAVAERVRELQAEGITRVDLVGHSMGGLVAREYLRARKDTRVAVPTLITVATPNHGNGKAAGLLELLGGPSATSQMAAGSDFLDRLNAADLPAGTRGYGLRTPQDEVVRPSDSCILPDAENFALDVGGLGAHMAMAFHPDSLRLIHELLVGRAPARTS